ncbi:MAG: methylated-DNA--[protein]-cysteine S-methyltransferase [candidate division FCPU426 bacterium]
MEKLKFNIIETEWGFAAAAAGRLGLRYLILPKADKDQAFQALAQEAGEVKLAPEPKDPELKRLALRLREYFQGRAVAWDFKLDFYTATPFQRQVWGVARTIPYGRTETYGWVAGMLGDPDARRAVGQALHANPLPLLVPCHRVTAARGKLGGFSGGAELKSRLLQLERAILT